MESNLKKLREDKDKKQREIATLLGVRQEQYSRWERKPSTMPIDHYMTLAKYYNVSIDYICGLIRRNLPLDRVKKETIQKTNNQVKLISENREEITKNISAKEFELLKEIVKLMETRKKYEEIKQE